MATSLDQILGYGRDVAQGASNAVASNVSAPVDGIAWLLKKAGLDVGEPVGGSDWMARKGLTAQPKNALAGLLGESFGMAGPMVAAAKAPQIAAGLNQMAANAAARPTLNPQTGAIVWHGSPHQFDAFDSSKIGTGEGAQAYGHGLYLAESPDVARSYQEALSSTGAAQRTVAQSGGDLDAALKSAQSSVDGYRALIANGGGGDMRRAQGMLSIAEKKLEDIGRMKAGIPENTGSLYKVDLPDEKIARMLDWDKPLSQQAPEVQAGLKQYMGAEWDKTWDNFQGVNAYDVLANGRHGNPTGNVEAAEKLRKAGIPGIRYLDGGSRNAGTGSSNFVVFPGEENVLRILERNGKQLP